MDNYRFIADIMLGRLARHLRALGYDVLIKPFSIDLLFDYPDRIILTRKLSIITNNKNLIKLYSEILEKQIEQLKQDLKLTSNPSMCFTRCINCNHQLIDAQEDIYKNNIPEFIQTTHRGKIKYCPNCLKFFWPGTHRIHMEKKFKEWGLL